MSTGAWVAVAAVVLALGFGLWRRVSDGRFRGGPTPAPAPAPERAAERTDVEPEADGPGLLDGTAYADQVGEHATLLQFSSAFCAPCRATRRVLSDVAADHTGVAHVEVDAEAHLELVRRLDVRRTPTTLVLDAHGREVVRAAGAPTRTQVEAAVARLTTS